LRAVAVVAVIVYHLNPSWLPGGYLGVDVFFVISGYLITSLLLSEFHRAGRVNVAGFWRRRARRLLPAVAVLLLAVTALAAFFARDALGELRADVPASIFYVMNWRLVFQHASYTSSFGRPPLLQHLWSLSVEEQFYLLWPPLLLILLRRRFTRRRIAWVAISGAALSAALMAVLFSRTDPSRVYFASPTHAQGLLIGCALAAAVPPWRMTAAVSPAARRLLERAGVAAMLVVLTGLVFFRFESAFTYRGGMVLVDLATSVVIATVAHPASRLGAGLARQPLRWLGLRSYSLYLWHWPIFMMTRPGLDLAWSTLATVGLRLGLTAGAAELSYRYIEQPWREGRAQLALKARLASLPRMQVAAVVAAPVVLIAAVLATAPGTSEPPVLSEGSTPAARTLFTTSPPTLATSVFAPPPTLPGKVESADLRAQARHAAANHAPATTVARAPAITAPPFEPILALGDSVLLAASPSLTAAFGPNITVDAEVGRQVQAGLTRLAAYRTSGALARYHTVVVDLGTNGAFTAAQFDQLSALLAGVPRVVVYNVYVPRPWAGVTNTTVAQGVAAHAQQMTLVNWNATAGAAGLLYPDHVHPDPAGATAYTQLLERALNS
jgi:peptidoglycan/LPS O-acetylase OafA/YrhL